MTQWSPDSIAVLRLAEGGLRSESDDAWLWFQQAWPTLERFVYRRLTTARLAPALLADCGQNVFVRIWRFRGQYRGTTEAEFWAWVRTISDNEHRRILTRSARSAHEIGDGGEAAASAEATTAIDPTASALHSEALHGLRNCLNQLDAELRTVVALLYFPPNLSERAAAALLGVGATTVHKRKIEALRRLAGCLGENSAGPEHAGSRGV